MDEIFKRILDRLNGTDFWIALGFLAAGLVWWKLIGTVTTRKTKVLRRQLAAAFLLTLLAGITFLVTHAVFLRQPAFPKTVTGILVMRIVGDDALHSLQAHVVGKLDGQLQKERTGQKIEVRAGREQLDDGIGLPAAHRRAQVVGKALNAALVIWGRKIGDKIFYSRITLTAPPLHWAANTERTHDMQTINDLQLPDDLVEEPFYLIHFAAGYSYYSQKRYKDALPLFEAALQRKGALANELADLQFFTANCLIAESASKRIAFKKEEHLITNLHEAITLYESALKGYAQEDSIKWTKTQNNIACAYLSLYDGNDTTPLDLALARLNECIRTNHGDASLYFNRGVVYLAKTDYDRAISDCTASIHIRSVNKLDPENAEAYHIRGRAFYAKADYDNALADYDEAIRLDPTQTEYFKSRAFTHKAKGGPDKAIADFNELLRINPNDVTAYTDRGAIYADKGDYEKGIADYDAAIRIDPTFANAYFNRGFLHKANADYDSAIADFTSYISLNPQEPDGYAKRGGVYHAAKSYEKAVADYSNAIAIRPTLADLYIYRGIVYQSIGDIDKAMADYTTAIRLDPKSSGSYVNRGVLLLTKGDWNRAIREFNQAIRIDPTLTLAYYNRATAYLSKGDEKAAILDLTETIRLHPVDAEAHAAMARILAVSKRDDIRDGNRAVQYAIRACDLSEWQNLAFLNILAMAYAEAGDFEQAIRWGTLCLNTPELSEADVAMLTHQLALYKAHKTYHDKR